MKYNLKRDNCFNAMFKHTHSENIFNYKKRRLCLSIHLTYFMM